MEYSLLATINNKPSYVKATIPDTSLQVSAGILNDTTDLYVKYDDELLFSTKEDIPLPDNLGSSDSSSYQKKYLFTNENGKDYIYVVSTSNIDSHIMNIITKRDITDSKQMMNKSIRDFRTFIIVMLCLS